MKNLTLILICFIMGVSCSNAAYKSESFVTKNGEEVKVIFIKHGSVAFDIDGYMVYVDPVTIFGDDFSEMPKADLILITHEHHDHLDKKAIEQLSDESTIIYSSPRVGELLKGIRTLKVGDKIKVDEVDLSIETLPAYNTTEGHLQFHPKERGDLGFLFNVDGLKIYVAGDTEDIPEMKNLGNQNIDIAFLPVNQPYTMTPTQAINAAEMIKPKIFYPYHYGNTDLTPIVKKYKGTNIDVRIEGMN